MHMQLGHSLSVSECLSTFFAFVCSTCKVSLLGVCSVSFGRGCSIVTAGGACLATPRTVVHADLIKCQTMSMEKNTFTLWIVELFLLC